MAISAYAFAFASIFIESLNAFDALLLCARAWMMKKKTKAVTIGFIR